MDHSVLSKSSCRTPMSERQQLALIRQRERSVESPNRDFGTQGIKSPPRTPLQAVNGRGETVGGSGSKKLCTPSGSPATPVQDKILRKLRKKNAKGETPLHAASIRGNPTLVKRLLQLGASPDVKDNAGWSPLHEASNRGNLEVVKVLVRFGANLNSLGDGRETPLHDAARNGHLRVVKFLVKSGANLAARNVSGRTPFEVAAQPENRCRNPRLEETIQFLKYQGENLTCDSDEDLSSSLSESEDESPENDVAKFLGLSNCGDYLFHNLIEVGDMKKALVNKSNNSGEKGGFSCSPRLTVRLQQLEGSSNTPSSIKTRLTYGMEESKPGSSSTTNIDSSTGATASTATNSPSVSAPSAASSSSGTTKEDVYEFKSSSKEATPVSSRSSQSPEPNKAGDSNDTKALADEKTTEKRPSVLEDNSSEEDPKRKKTKKDETVSSKGRGSRGSSMEKTMCPKTAKARLGASFSQACNSERKTPPSTPPAGNNQNNSPRKTESDSDDDNSKKSTDSAGLKVPPLKIVLSNNGGGGSTTPPNGSIDVSTSGVIRGGNSVNNENLSCGNEKSGGTRYVTNKDEQSSGNEESKSDYVGEGENSSGSNDKGVPSRMTRSKALHGTPGAEGEFQGTSSSSEQTSGETSDNKDQKNISSDYSFKKRKLRSQVDEAGNSLSSVSRGGGNNMSGNMNNSSNSNGSSNTNSGNNGNGGIVGGGTTGNSITEPLNDIEKYLNIRKQVEQRRKNLFPVQPKPPQGFKDYLMNRKTYLLQENANERLRQIPLIQPPPSLEGAMAELFKEQEESRYKLRMKHVVEKEKLVLSVEQEILRVHGRAARALANQSLPYSLCTILRDEEIYTPIDPQQEEKNRDIRSRYNGRLFLSWLQDVDDKWERIKEQMVLRHHNEAESLNAVQKMDWEWKLKEISDNPSSFNDSIKPQIDDLLIPMVHVSDDFDLTDCRN